MKKRQAKKNMKKSLRLGISAIKPIVDKWVDRMTKAGLLIKRNA